MILVTGAGGSNGSELIKRLSATGLGPQAAGPKKDALLGVEFVTADFEAPIAQTSYNLMGAGRFVR